MLTRGIEADIGETAFPSALIIAPTRELAVQIFLESRKFSFGSHLRTVVIYGGVSVSHQLGKLYDGCDILVATPGRLNDFLKRSRVSSSFINLYVLCTIIIVEFLHFQRVDAPKNSFNFMYYFVYT